MICKNLKDCYNDPTYNCTRKSFCIAHRDDRKNVMCKENQKRYNLVNPHRFIVTVYHMDGGIIENEANVNKCDFLYGIQDNNNPTAIFIELKGKNIPHSLKQIEASITGFSNCFRGHRIHARIICKAVPRLYNDPSIQNYRKELIKKYNGSLIIAENTMDEDYDQIKKRA